MWRHIQQFLLWVWVCVCVGGAAGSHRFREEHPAVRSAAPRLHRRRNLYRWHFLELRLPAHMEESLRSGAAGTVHLLFSQALPGGAVLKAT